MQDLPPDLDRLGSALTHAVGRARDARRHRAALRRRLAGALAAGLLVFAAMTPSHLGRADRQSFFGFGSAGKAEAAVFCDVPRGAGGKNFQLPEPCIPRHPAPQAAR